MATATTSAKPAEKQNQNSGNVTSNGHASDRDVASLVKDNVPAAAATKGGSLLWGRIRDADSFIANFGAAVGKSGLFGVGRPEEGRVLVASWMHNNEDPLAWKRRHHVIAPKIGPKQITMHYAAMLADFEELGGDYEIVERSPERAALKLKYKSREYLSEITHEEISQEPYYSDKQGNPKDRYATPQSRKEQLWARAVSDGMRTICSRVNYGTYTPEEAADFVVPSDEQKEAEKEPDRSIREGHEALDNWEKTIEQRKQEEQQESAPFDSDSESIPMVNKDQLRTIKECKDALEIGTDAWKKVLTKYNVSTAKELTHDQADKLIVNMMRKVDAVKAQDNLSAWAEGATAKN